MTKHNLIWKIGDTVKITTEEPIWREGVNLSGKSGILVKYSNREYYLKFSNGKILRFRSGTFAVPNWFRNIHNSDEMERLGKNERNRI